ncbi:MAG: 50S ribosomal protein L23, partial [Verrucomicrobiales bacterium]|nr:50S ribosomal protein L23 [Verrucomicrobiales bacterium]
MKDLYSVIKTIRLSEKATRLSETNNEYVFVVDPKANKLEIQQAVEKIFGKKVEAVRTA